MQEVERPGVQERPGAPANLLPVEEVAGRLRCSSAHVRRLIRSGALPAVNIGGRRAALRVPEQGVEAFLAARVIGGSAVAAS